MPTSAELHKQIVRKFLDTKAVDFAAIGKTIAELGSSLALSDEVDEIYCGTVRHFVTIYKLPTYGGPVENLGELRSAAKAM